MASMNSITPDFLEANMPSSTPAKPEMLVSAVLHLMSQYTVSSAGTDGRHACLKLASVIERHLKILAGLPDLAPVLRATCQQLSEQWASVVENTLPRRAGLKLITRLVAGKE
jgi:hypothetical protein